MEVQIEAAIEDVTGTWKVTDMGDWDVSLKLKVQMNPGSFARVMNLRKQQVSSWRW